MWSTVAFAQTQDYQVDEYGSHRVTHFLHNHDLPLVGAQIIDNNDGSRELHLFGFVATPYGMRDAQQKALKYLGDKTIKVVNSVQVNPSLKNMTATTPSAAENSPPPDNMGIPNYVANPGKAPNPDYVPNPTYPTNPGYPTNPNYPADTGSQGSSTNQWDKAMGNILKNGAQPLPQPQVPASP